MMICEAQAAAWAVANAHRKEVEHHEGDYVMVHAPIRTKGEASRLTENWVGPFRVLKCNGHKNYTLRHIDCGREVHQTVSNMCVALEELPEREYDERYNSTRSVTTPVSEELHEGDMVLVRTHKGVVPAQVWCALDVALFTSTGTMAPRAISAPME